MLLSALYYPHTAVRDLDFLKHALLYWDEVEFISPFSEFIALPRYPDSRMKELARILKPRVPTEEEKRRAHDQIMKLVEGELPQWLKVDRVSSEDDHQLYSMFAHKLLPQTWDELKHRDLVQLKRHGDVEDYASHTYLGLTLMAILARCCAGEMKHTITDQSDSYYAILKHLQFLSGEDESGGNDLDPNSKETFKRWLNTLGVSQSRIEDENRKILVSITLEVIDSKELSVEDLLTLRYDKTQFATELRQNYARAIEDYVNKLSIPGIKENDAQALAGDFRRQMKKDLARLYDELKLVGRKTILSKEVGVALAAPIVGSIVLTSSGIGSILGGALAIGALGRLDAEYKAARNAVFQKHPMAFLYAKQGVRLY